MTPVPLSATPLVVMLPVFALLGGCSSCGPCPKGASAERSATQDVDGGVLLLCRRPGGSPDGPVLMSYDDGNRPRLTGRFEQGRPTGLWTWWHASGTKRASYAFGVGESASIPAGKWETWHPNGTLHWQLSFEGGAPHGPVSELREDGTRRFEGSFSNGRRSGTWTAWYPTGGKAGEGHYEDDSPAAAWTVWWKSGAIAGVRSDKGQWKFSEPDGGALTENEFRDVLHPAVPGKVPTSAAPLPPVPHRARNLPDSHPRRPPPSLQRRKAGSRNRELGPPSFTPPIPCL